MNIQNQLGDYLQELRKANESLLGQVRGLTAKADKLNAEVGSTLNRLQAAHEEIERMRAHIVESIRGFARDMPRIGREEAAARDAVFALSNDIENGLVAR